MDTEVIIVGAGPAGMVAAMDLDARGISTIVLERRRFLQLPSVKSNHVSARTMERFRMLGIADSVRKAGLPVAHSHDVSFRTTVTGHELSRIPIPSSSERFSSKVGPDTQWATPEPPHRINQTYLEPILMKHLATLPNVQLMNETEMTSFTQGDNRVSVHARSVDGAGKFEFTAQYLIGCDGGSSMVRKAIGSQFRGDGVLQEVQSTCIRAPRLIERVQGEPAWCYYTFNPRRNGSVYAIDGNEIFLVHAYLSEQESREGSVDRDEAIRTILGVDKQFDYDVVSCEDWTARRLVADRLSQGRVFICGDAAHIWVPFAGYGMNAGIADALNLTWLLGSRLGGWGASGILEAYDAERQPITEQVSIQAMRHSNAVMAARASVPVDVEKNSAAGAAARSRVGAEAYDLNVKQFAAEGLNFGYCYDHSPIILYDGEQAPELNMDSYTPSTAPGCRLPHFFLGGGYSLYDKLGHGYTLVVTDTSVDYQPLVVAALGRGIPLSVVNIADEDYPPQYQHALIVCRQDQHVAWRGNTVPDDLGALLDRLCGVFSAG